MSSPRPSSSLAARALLALLLMVGFYVLALGLAGALLYIPYAEVTYGHRIHFKVALFCLAGAGIILWSVMPRIDRFTPPGLLLREAAQPRLFAAIRELAGATQQPMPDEVYLVSDMNAFVTQRGGLMGVGSRRVMGLGLPLLQALNVAEVRAVVAHEFGHFHGGDVKLGPWIYKTRGAIVRTVHSLGQNDSILQKPFLWYGEMFIKVTHAISRQQEFAADALAARTVGAGPLASGLKRVHAAALAYHLYWQEDVLPALGSGWRPPFAAGFAHFLGAQRARTLMDKSVADELQDGEADPYDTHPPLRERVDAVRELPAFAGASADDPRPAVDLLDGLTELEQELVEHIAADASVAQQLKPIAWSEVATRIHLPMWREHASTIATPLAGCTLATLSSKHDLREQLGRVAAGEHADGAEVDVLVRFGAARLAAVITLGLIEQGFALDAMPGEHVTLVRGEHAVRPFEVLLDRARVDECIDDLRAACTTAGVTDVDLGAVAAQAEARA